MANADGDGGQQCQCAGDAVKAYARGLPRASSCPRRPVRDGPGKVLVQAGGSPLSTMRAG